VFLEAWNDSVHAETARVRLASGGSTEQRLKKEDELRQQVEEKAREARLIRSRRMKAITIVALVGFVIALPLTNWCIWQSLNANASWLFVAGLAGGLAVGSYLLALFVTELPSLDGPTRRGICTVFSPIYCLVHKCGINCGVVYLAGARREFDMGTDWSYGNSRPDDFGFGLRYHQHDVFRL
jgi:hypothetical protein